MSKPWPKVKLSEVLRHRKQFVTIDDVATYRRPRVQLQVRGVVLRDEVPGALIKTKKQQICFAGDFLVAEIDAKVGGFGIVPSSLEGSIVSSHYFLFVIDESKLDRRFLDFFIRTATFREQVEAQGSTNYAAIRPAHVLGYEIPLPTLAEQRRAVVEIEKVAESVGAARTLRREADKLTAVLLENSVAHIFQKLSVNAPTRTLGDLLSRHRRQAELVPSVEYQGLGTRMWGLGVYVHESRLGHAFEAERYEVRPNQLIYNEVWAHNGALGIVPHLGPNIVVSRHFHVFEVNWENLTPDYLQRLFQSHWFWNKCRGGSVSSTGRGHLRREHFSAIQIPVPSLPEQCRIAAELEVIHAKTDALTRVQAETTAELDALLPAILDRAFKGELLPRQTVESVPRVVEPPTAQHSRRFVRTVFASEIVARLHGERTFGQVKFQKALFLAEYAAQIVEIESHAERFQNGPHDPELIREVEAEMSDRDWFESYARPDGAHGHAYRSLAHAGEHVGYFESFWPKKASSVRRVIDTLLKWDTERCERLATAYAGWNDLLIWNWPVTDTAILTEILERWHPAKLKIPKAKWQETLAWMREHAFVPTGFGQTTAPEPQNQLF